MENREKKKVVIVIPVHRLPLLPEEKISLQHLRHFLSGYDQCLVVPRSLNVPGEVLEDMKLRRFDDLYFANIDGYNRLMLSQAFYRKFRAYEYILLYQLDCLVFSEDLRHWCKQGWDYVGAPWFKGHRGETSDGLWAVGNGGLSLRKVSAFLNVLRTRRIWRSAIEVANETPRFLRYPKIRKLFILSKAIFHAFGYKNTIGYFIRTFPQYEDLFGHFTRLKSNRISQFQRRMKHCLSPSSVRQGIVLKRTRASYHSVAMGGIRLTLNSGAPFCSPRHGLLILKRAPSSLP